MRDSKEKRDEGPNVCHREQSDRIQKIVNRLLALSRGGKCVL